jgi:hypothetical protein
MRNYRTITLLGMALSYLSIPAVADDVDRSCSVATLKGTYGLSAIGIRPVPPSVQVEMHATLALRAYDGKGGFKTYPIVSNGQISGVMTGLPVGTGTYSVNADCTGKATLTIPGLPPIEAMFIIVDQGLEIQEVPTGAGSVGVATLRRQ